MELKKKENKNRKIGRSMWNVESRYKAEIEKELNKQIY